VKEEPTSISGEAEGLGGSNQKGKGGKEKAYLQKGIITETNGKRKHGRQDRHKKKERKLNKALKEEGCKLGIRKKTT